MAISGSKPNKVTVDGTEVTVRAGSGIPGPKGDTGSQGPAGSAGPAGTAATVAVGTTTTLAPGSSATVTNSGTAGAAVLNFGIPQGATGPAGSTGPTGSAATITVGTTTTLSPGSSATVTNSGTAGAAVLNFGIPQGATGSTGATGAAGSAATIAVGSVTTGTAGSTATVTNSGTSSAAVLNFTIPRGDKGDKGDTGTAGTNGTNGTNGDWSTAQTLNSQSAGYALAASDVGKLVVFTSGSAINCTIGTAVALSAGQRVDILQTGAGQVTFVASSTTVNGTPGLKLRAQYSAATVLCTAANTYVVLGDLSA